MKRTFTLLLGLSVLAGCSKEETGNNDNGALVPIELSAEVNVISRAAVNSGDAIGNAGIAGWDAKGDVGYQTDTAWYTTISTEQNNTTVKWAKQPYYNASADFTTYMKAWYPGGTFDATNKTVTFTNTDGSIDAMLAPVVSGSKDNKVNSELTFQHMTSQIKFSVKKGEGLAEGTEIESITIKNAQLPTGFDLTKGISEEGAVTYAAAADLAVPNIDISKEITNTDTGDPVGDAVMIKPMLGNTFTVDIVTNNASYTDKTVQVTTDNVQAGYAYDITLTFGQAGIELNATVVAWQSASGSAEIQ